jgi:hypothetical protein
VAEPARARAYFVHVLRESDSLDSGLRLMRPNGAVSDF